MINSMCKSTDTDNSNLKDGNIILAKNREKICGFFDREKKKLLADIQSYWDTSKNDLCNYASSFAQNHYDDIIAGMAWEKDPTVKSIYVALNNKVQSRLQDFNNKAKSEVKEVADDIHIIFTSSSSGNPNVSVIKIKNTRLAVGLAGTIVTAAAPFLIANFWNPAGWIVALATDGLSIVISIFTSSLKSKQEKIKEATENLKKQLCDNICSSIEKSSSKAKSDIISSVDKMKMAIDDVLKTYIENIQSLTSNLDELTAKCLSDENTINSLIGFRILEYAGEKVLSEHKIDTKDNAEIRDQYPVQRDWKNQSLTYLYPVKVSEQEIANAEKATQMKIIINR